MHGKIADNQNASSTFEKLRLKAEALIQQQPEIASTPPPDILDLIHELKINHAELEMQNEELRRAQNEIIELQQEYHDLYEFAPCGYVTLNGKGGITHANLSAVGLLGVERKILSYSVFSSFIASGWESAYHSARAKAGESGKKQVVELPLKRAGGLPLWVRLEIAVHHDETGEVIQWRVAIVDISERKLLEEALQQKAHSLGERVKELNCLYEISNLRDQPDITMAEMFQGIADLIPKSWQYPQVACCRIRIHESEYLSEKFEETKWEISEKITINGNKGGAIEIFYLEEKPSSGEGLFLKEERLFIKVIAERLGKYMEHLAAKAELQQMHDRLEQRVEERTSELKKNKILLQTVFDGIPDPLFLLDKNMRIDILNKSAMEYYQVDKDNVINTECYHAFKGKPEPCDGCQVPSAIASQINMSFERRGFRDPSRLERVTIYQVDKEFSGSGGAVLRIQDITETKSAERQAMHNEKLASLGLMVSCIAHEIANPVSAVTFNAPILKDYIEAMIPIVDEHAHNVDDFEMFEMPYSFFRKDVVSIIHNILHASKRIEATVKDLRRIYGTRKERVKTWTDVKAVIENAMAVVLVETDQPIRSFEIDVPENLPKLYTDTDAIEQILTNLLTNAMHAADKENATVKLKVFTGNSWQDHLIIEVRDNGSGINAETLPKIFKPFFSTRQPGLGTGLGLYVCEDLVQILGGRIEVETEVERGSVFRVILPDLDQRSINRF